MAGTTPSIDEYQAAGLYDPAIHDGTDHLLLLDWLTNEGFTIAELQRAYRTNNLAALASDRRLVPGERLGREVAVDGSGLTAAQLDALTTALEMMPIDGAPAGEVGYTPDEIEVLRGLARLSTVFSDEAALAVVRVVGSSLARIADASVSMFLADVESPHLIAGGSQYELAHAVYDAVGLVDQLAKLEPLLRRQMLQAIERSRRATIDEADRSWYRYALGFIDVVGFTSASSEMSAGELADFVGRFEARARDVTTGAGARVIKLIGDAVMFVATGPDALCRAGVALMAAFGDDGVLPRGGLAYGNVLPRGGDFYGSVVNLAARLVDEAVPGELLVSDGLATAATGCHFEPAGRRMLKGFAEPVRVHTLVSAAPER